MFNDLFIGIDIGSSSLKALAVDGASGRAVAVARQALPYERLAGGGCEVRGAAGLLRNSWKNSFGDIDTLSR